MEKDMEVLQKIFIAAAVIFVVGGIVWFIFIAHWYRCHPDGWQDGCSGV